MDRPHVNKTSHRRARLRLPQFARVLFFLIAVVGFLSTTIPAQAASVTWTGLGITNNWNDGLNWSTGTMPALGDVAIFDATSTKNATINVAANVAGIQISGRVLGHHHPVGCHDHRGFFGIQPGRRNLYWQQLGDHRQRRVHAYRWELH